MKRLSGGLLASMLLHTALYGAALGLIAWREAHTDFRADIDQTNAPLLALANRTPPPPPKPWVLAKKAKQPPKPLATPTPIPTPEEEAVAVVASRQPAWTGGFITEDDYPVEMRRRNKQGKVIAEVLIDIEGNVKSVSIVQGSDPAFDQVVLEKLKAARFRPALDKSGNPINCRVRIPINFTL